MKRNKIILYHPKTHHEKFYSFFWIPYSLLTIASVLPSKCEVQIIDDNLEKNELNFEFFKNCLCVGISVMTGHQIKGALNLSKRIKELNSNIPIIWGGAHPTLLPEITIKNQFVDFIVLGQGEFIFKELVDEIENKKDFERINNIVFKKKGRIVKTKRTGLTNRNKLPDFRWSLINIEKYIRNDEKIGSRVLNYVSSLGCPFNCTFCSEVALYNRKWIAFDNQRIIKDIKYLLDEGRANSIKFFDANFFGNKRKAIDFAKLVIEKDIIFNWAAAIHPKTLANLSKIELSTLQKSKCKRLLIGAESGYQVALDMIDKRITPDLILETAKRTSQYDIVGSFTFIVGFPSINNEKEISQTLKIANKVLEINDKHDVKIHFYAPYPGTPLFKNACKSGFKQPITLEDWAEYDYYNIETPWLKMDYENLIHDFNSKNCIYVHL